MLRMVQWTDDKMTVIGGMKADKGPSKYPQMRPILGLRRLNTGLLFEKPATK
jgi:hypothetical protein